MDQAVWSQADHTASKLDPPNLKLTEMWLRAIVKHAFYYAEHRIAHFNSELYFIVPRHHATLAPSYISVFQKHESKAQQSLKWLALDYLRYNFLSAPFFSFVLAFTLIGLMYTVAKLHPFKEAILALACSSFFYTGGFLLVGVATDARYQFWSLMSAYLAILLFSSAHKKDIGRSILSRSELILASIAVLTIVVTFVVQLIETDVLFQHVV